MLAEHTNPMENRISPVGPVAEFDALQEELLAGPYLIVDILPAQVPARAPGQYGEVARYFRQPQRLRALYRRFAEILLRLNCYYEMWVRPDWGAAWEKDPAPEALADVLEMLPPGQFFRAVFPAQRAMIDLDAEDTNLTVYGGSGESGRSDETGGTNDTGGTSSADDNDGSSSSGSFLAMLQALAAAEGLFVWAPPE